MRGGGLGCWCEEGDCAGGMEVIALLVEVVGGEKSGRVDLERTGGGKVIETWGWESD